MSFPRIGTWCAAVLFVSLNCSCSRPEHPPVLTAEQKASSLQPDPQARSCAACHQDIYHEWIGSQHANANRLVSDEHDRAAFEPSSRIEHGSFVTTMLRTWRGDFHFQTTFSNNPAETLRAEAVIGISPLRQYLVSYPGGRLQVMDISYDPRSNEWFNAFGDENRQPGEWGHWSGRSMTWNVQCAFCHMTGYEKKYEIKEDRYASTWKAMGISCTQCHTLKAQASEDSTACPMVEAFPVGTRHPVPGTAVMDNCASCHARREELFGTFKPGDSFHDHFRLILPDVPGIFHADGQVLDEDFEYASFMMSRMGHKGVTCLDCHNPHSGKLKAPVENNALCMQCHTPPGLNHATPIDPAAHMFHPPGTPGGRCVDCHMPENFYMVRDARRDHGFTSPDPLLTMEHGIPNACNRCHQEQTPSWAAEWTDRWYGEKMNRRARDRARIVARYYAGDATVTTGLLAMAQGEEIDAWRAALVGMLSPWNAEESVRSFLTDQYRHTSPLVRSAAIRAMEDAPTAALADAAALVRVDATMARYARQPFVKPPTLSELRAYLDNISDQPAGAMRQAHLATIENRADDAEAWIQKAVDWDPSSALPYHQLGRIQFANHKHAAALSNLYAAAMMEVANAEFSYSLALAFAETGNNKLALQWLEETVRRDERFGRAWYNLGLAHAENGNLPTAIEALKKAQSLMPQNGDAAYARATLHAREGRPAEAYAAAREALEADSGHQAAQSMLRSLRINTP